MPTARRYFPSSSWKSCISRGWSSPSRARLRAQFPALAVRAVWWAFTFPLDALAYAAARYAQSHPSMPWKLVAALALAVATLFVVVVLWKMFAALHRERRELGLRLVAADDEH